MKMYIINIGLNSNFYIKLIEQSKHNDKIQQQAVCEMVQFHLNPFNSKE